MALFAGCADAAEGSHRRKRAAPEGRLAVGCNRSWLRHSTVVCIEVAPDVRMRFEVFKQARFEIAECAAWDKTYKATAIEVVGYLYLLICR